jgi:hypothetical protein
MIAYVDPSDLRSSAPAISDYQLRQAFPILVTPWRALTRTRRNWLD